MLYSNNTYHKVTLLMQYLHLSRRRRRLLRGHKVRQIGSFDSNLYLAGLPTTFVLSLELDFNQAGRPRMSVRE